MNKKTADLWFPVWIDKWLFGSTRIELQPDERSVFFDLIVLSKKDEGYIRANKGVPYLESQLCGLLNITPELLQRTVNKCKRVGKIKQCRDRTLFISGHCTYNLSERWKRELNLPEKQTEVASAKTEVASAKTEVASEKAEARGEDIRREDIKGDKKRGEDIIFSSSPPLPAIPKGLEFKIQDELKNRLAEIRSLKRKLNNKEIEKKFPMLKNDILSKISKKEKEYRELIEDYS